VNYFINIQFASLLGFRWGNARRPFSANEERG